MDVSAIAGERPEPQGVSAGTREGAAGSLSWVGFAFITKVATEFPFFPFSSFKTSSDLTGFTKQCKSCRGHRRNASPTEQTFGEHHQESFEREEEFITVTNTPFLK